MKCSQLGMSGRGLLFPCLLLLLFLPAPANAATRYVNNSGSPACSDSAGNGTLPAPYCTITYALSQSSSGDTVDVRTGTYTEYLSISGPAGTAGHPTVIQAYPGDSPILYGPNTSNGRVHITATSYITFSGFQITNYNQALYVENGSTHIVVSNLLVYNIGQQGITVDSNSSYVLLQGNTVHDTGQCCYNGEGFYIGTGSGGPLDNTNNVTLLNNTVYNTTDEGVELKPGTWNCIVDGNTFHNNNTANNGYGGAAIELDGVPDGVQRYSGNPNHIVRNNIVHSNGPGTGGYSINSGIHLGTGATAYNNVVYGINTAQGYGMFSDNQSGDSFTRYFYYNTIDEPSAYAFSNQGGTVVVSDNIGPTTTNNIATNSSYYVNESAANYQLVAGAAPITAGTNLTSTVTTDITGVVRADYSLTSTGAYVYTGASASTPAAPTGLVAVVH